jgi:hypothetical protein
MDSLDFPRWKVFLLDSRFSFLWRLRESWPFRHIEKKGDLFRLIFG